jgi:hypothetical protein
MIKRQLTLIATVLLLVCSTSVLGQGQQRFQRPFLATRGDTVTPSYEGWYPNEDGTITVSFGYYNRNSEEVVYIPIGPDNNITPENVVQAQPEYFQPRRHYGTFAVTVPADYNGEIWWNLNFRGEKISIPSNMTGNWKVDSMGPTIMGNFPPKVKYSSDGKQAIGPQGFVIGPLDARVGKPLSVDVWVEDDGVRRVRGDEKEEGKEVPPVANLDLIKYRGPGNISFEKQRLEYFDAEGFETPKTIVATFDTPGEYRIRALATDASGVRGDEQCCWTNTFIDVTVTP